MIPPAVKSPALDGAPGIVHGFFGRQGGVSSGIYASLNAGPGSKDDPTAVAENRARIAVALGVAPQRLLSANQVHSPHALTVDAPWTGPRPEADALVTAVPGLAVSALAADCAPVLFADPQARVVAAAHAGWKGALSGVLEATVAAMEQAGARRERIVAAIGPCIGQESYEVGPEFIDRLIVADAANRRFFVPGQDDRAHFDLAGFCAARLRALDLRSVDALGLDTKSRDSEYFSHRRAVKAGEPDYGRNLSAIALVG